MRLHAAVEAVEVAAGEAGEVVVMVVAVEEIMAAAILEGEGIAQAAGTRLQDRALVTCPDQVLANLLLDQV